MHQTETGRPVTDAVVQEVCKLRPDMIGLSLRDCIEVRLGSKNKKILRGVRVLSEKAAAFSPGQRLRRLFVVTRQPPCRSTAKVTFLRTTRYGWAHECEQAGQYH